jgi:hypothetical protein
MENLENKTKETIKKKRSVFDKIVSKALIPLAIVSVGYLVNTSVCSHMRNYYVDQMSKTPAYQEFVKVNNEMNNLDIVNKNYNAYLSEEGKKAIEQRVIVLTEKKEQLIPELKPYEEKANEWVQRAQNPLEYFK